MASVVFIRRFGCDLDTPDCRSHTVHNESVKRVIGYRESSGSLSRASIASLIAYSSAMDIEMPSDSLAHISIVTVGSSGVVMTIPTPTWSLFLQEASVNMRTLLRYESTRQEASVHADVGLSCLLIRP